MVGKAVHLVGNGVVADIDEDKEVFVADTFLEQALSREPAESLIAVAFLIGKLFLELLAGQLILCGIVQQHLRFPQKQLPRE